MCEAERMTCPLCGHRKARRDCPALRQTICAVCCGTKRLTEIDCPSECVHLASAREHPAAVVRRQQERDAGIIVPTIRHLTERQQQLFFLFHAVIARHTPDGLARLVDEDVAEATSALARTIETAARGVIYEHSPQSIPAQKLAGELKAMLAEARQAGASIYDGEIAITLRAIEAGARDVNKAVDGDASYLDLMRRLLQIRAKGAEAGPKGGLIVVP
jgi:hypothetical protein